MARNQSTLRMRRRFQAHLEADKRGVPVDLVLEEHKERSQFQRLYSEQKISRREFIRGMGIAGASAAALLALGSCVPDTDPNLRRDPQPSGSTDERLCGHPRRRHGRAELRLHAERGWHWWRISIEADHRLGGRIATHMPDPPPESGRLTPRSSDLPGRPSMGLPSFQASTASCANWSSDYDLSSGHRQRWILARRRRCVRDRRDSSTTPDEAGAGLGELHGEGFQE